MRLAAQYENDPIVGALAIAFSVLVTTMPGMSMEGMMDPKIVPQGWTYCHSTGAQRLPMKEQYAGRDRYVV